MDRYEYERRVKFGLWAMFMHAALGSHGGNAVKAGQVADASLVEFEKRFPVEEEADDAKA